MPCQLSEPRTGRKRDPAAPVGVPGPLLARSRADSGRAWMDLVRCTINLATSRTPDCNPQTLVPALVIRVPSVTMAGQAGVDPLRQARGVMVEGGLLGLGVDRRRRLCMEMAGRQDRALLDRPSVRLQAVKAAAVYHQARIAPTHPAHQSRLALTVVNRHHRTDTMAEYHLLALLRHPAMRRDSHQGLLAPLVLKRMVTADGSLHIRHNPLSPAHLSFHRLEASLLGRPWRWTPLLAARLLHRLT